jgi:hypothetical protein
MNRYDLYQAYVQSIYTNRNQTSALETSVGSAMIGCSEPARRPTWSKLISFQACFRPNGTLIPTSPNGQAD